MSRSSEPPRVLHVDDDPDFLDLTATFLERQAETLELEQSASAAAALDRLAETQFDCVVSDYDMPKTDGIEFLETVREECDDLPFILFTGKGSEEIAADAISAGVTDYLQKRGGGEQFALLANRIEKAVEAYVARREVTESEARLTRVYERITDGFFAVDEDWEYTYVNESGATLVGMAPEELEGQRAWDAFPELEDSAFGEALRTAMTSQETQAIEEYYPAHEQWYDVTVYPAQDGISIYFRDVTERKERERHRRLMEHVLEAVDDGVVIVRDGTFEFVNPRFAEMVGYDQAELRGMGMADLVAPEYRDLIRERHQARLAGDAQSVPDVYEIEVLPADGERVPVEVNASEFEYEGDRATVTILRDVSDRAERHGRVEALHQATRDLMRAQTKQDIAEVAVETTSDILDMPMNGVVLYDEDSGSLEPVAASETAREVLGELPSFEPGEGLAWEIYSSGEVGVFEDVSTEAARINPETPIRSEIILPLGEHGVMTIGSTEVGSFDETDVALARTLAANIRAAMRRADREAELAAQNERLEEFTRIVSHDLRSPLAVVSGNLERAAAEGEDEHLVTARRRIEHMEALVDDLLTVARDGDREIDPVPIDLGALVRRSWNHVQTGDATLTVDVDRRIRADPVKCQQLLENLVLNAVEHAGPEPTVVVDGLDDGFYVADDGPGVPAEEREAIFEPGYSGRTDGTGYGLSIVTDIAAAHGWQVDVTESTAGGARFEITGVESE